MKPLITVFTPAYNRAGTLPDLYESLCRQTCFDFEWVIVDDDSSDNTKEVVNDMICGNTLFDISYYKQEHGGKHRAVNKGVSMAKGDYFFIVDSDDYLLPDAIRLIKSWVEEIGDVLHLAGVSGLRQYPDGTIVGEYPWKLLKDKEWSEADKTKRYINKLMGDKAEVYKTGLLKDHPFAEFDNEYFLTESTCWNKLASEGFSVRWYPVPIYVCEYQEGGLTKSGANSFTGHIKNKQGYSLQVRESLKELPDYEAATYFREYNHTMKKTDADIRTRAEGLNMKTSSYVRYMLVNMPVGYMKRMAVKVIRILK